MIPRPPGHSSARLERARLSLSGYQSDWLDWARGLAAVAVLVYHVRYRFFADWSEVSHSLASRAFYTATAFGHDAVVVFFVLSGLLISRSVFRSQSSGSWTWRTYAAARASRLYLVLLPGLLLTFSWDRLGLWLFPAHPIYTGIPATWWHDFFNVQARLGINELFGNAFFLQIVAVAPYGSNEALWSLSFEFWFYVVFPLLWFALDGHRRVSVRLAYGMSGLGLLFLLGSTIASYFPIWLVGAALWLIPRDGGGAVRYRFIRPLAAFVFASTLLACHSVLSGLSVVTRDYLTALTFAGLVYTVLLDHRREPVPGFARAGRLLAAQSYTLYVVHLPLLVFCRAWLGSDSSQWQPTPVTVLYGLGLTLAALVYAYVISRLTEAHTDACRRWLERRLWRGSAGGVPPHASPVSVAAAYDPSRSGERTA